MDIHSNYILKSIILLYSFICNIFKDYNKIIRKVYCNVIRSLLSIGKINNLIKLNKVFLHFFLISSFKLCWIKPSIIIWKQSAKLYSLSLKIICFSLNLKKTYHSWKSDFKTGSKYSVLFISWRSLIFKNISIIKTMNSVAKNK